jgi:hypothetical protein
MTLPTLQPEVIEALRSAGATEEMIAAAVKASGEFPTPHPSRGGRPRKYRTRAACDLAYRARRKLREKTCEETSQDEKTCEKTRSKDKTSQDEKTCEKTPVERYEIRDEIPGGHLRARLEEAGQGHFDADADIEPIQALLEEGCDLEADILPTVARTVPELPRPLKKWGAPWLVREILAAREARLAGHPV